MFRKQKVKIKKIHTHENGNTLLHRAAKLGISLEGLNKLIEKHGKFSIALMAGDASELICTIRVTHNK